MTSTPRAVGTTITRRRLLGSLAATGLAAAAAPTASRVLAAEDLDRWSAHEGHDLAEHRWTFVFDLRRCDGCRDCITGCQKQHWLPESQEWIRVHEVEGVAGQTYFLPVLCQLCDNAPCIQVCPVRATYYQQDGTIVIDQDRCIGCRMCMAACPYGVRVFNWDDPPEVPEFARGSTPEFRAPQVKGTVGKCDSCAHLLREGTLPGCVEACSMYAIYVGDLVEDAATNGRETVVLSRFLRENDAFRLKEELGTQPRVYYIAGHGQDLDY